MNNKRCSEILATQLKTIKLYMFLFIIFFLSFFPSFSGSLAYVWVDVCESKDELTMALCPLQFCSIIESTTFIMVSYDIQLYYGNLSKVI